MARQIFFSEKYKSLFSDYRGLMPLDEFSKVTGRRVRGDVSAFPKVFLGGLAIFLLFALPLRAEVELVGSKGMLLRPENKDFTMTANGFCATDFVAAKNTLDLDNKDKKDSFGYIGANYRLNVDIKYRDDVELFFGFERIGPLGYDAPILGRKSVPTISGDLEHYRNREFLPELKETFLDVKAPFTDAYPIRAKAGLFPLSIGNGFAVTGLYQNYGVQIYHPSETLAWHFNYLKPNWNNDAILGPTIPQEEALGRGYFHTQADLFELDTIYQWKKTEQAPGIVPGGSVQPYISFLSDRTGDLKRHNLFETQTHQDLLGTLGADLNLEFGRLAVGFEAAKNFGGAKSTTGDSGGTGTGDKDVVHKGYLLYADAAYDLKEYWLKPRSKVIVASGNKQDDSSGGLIHGSTNRAFSVYSPLNTNLSYSVYPPQKMAPLLFMGNTWGNNYGVRRPGTFNDPVLFENIVTPNVGLDITPHPKLTLTADWWHFSSFEQGVGTYNEISRKLSRNLGDEFDFGATVNVTKALDLNLGLGYFIPGDYYKAARDPDSGTTFSPQANSAGVANRALYFETRVTVKF